MVRPFVIISKIYILAVGLSWPLGLLDRVSLGRLRQSCLSRSGLILWGNKVYAFPWSPNTFPLRVVLRTQSSFSCLSCIYPCTLLPCLLHATTRWLYLMAFQKSFAAIITSMDHLPQILSNSWGRFAEVCVAQIDQAFGES
jgi:hypothetical protein